MKYRATAHGEYPTGLYWEPDLEREIPVGVPFDPKSCPDWLVPVDEAAEKAEPKRKGK